MSDLPAGRAGTGSEIVAVMLTDLVDSTGMSVRLGQQEADEARRQLFAANYDVVQGTGGELVKWLGDGVMAVYRSVVAALDGAVALQRAIDRLNRRRTSEALGMRVGLSVGEATQEDDDWYGTVVVEAARLCDGASSGQILANAIVGTLTGEHGGFELRALGTRVLKGFDTPVHVVEVDWSQRERSEAPLPFELERRTHQLFVGRGEALDQLQAAWDQVMLGDTRLALVSGEPGIGKTTLAAAFAARVAKSAILAYGHCDEQIVASYQPFADALRQIVARCDGDVLAAHAAQWQGAMLTLVPDLKDRVRGLTEPPGVDAESNEVRLFGATADLLARVGDDAPILLVVDDLHWANAPTLRFLAHLVHRSSPRPIRLLILATYLDTPIHPDRSLASMAPGLWSDPNVVHIQLPGLDDPDVVSLTESFVDQVRGASSVELARTIRASTGGNPFLVCEVLRHLVDSGALRDEDGVWQSQVPLVELSRLDSIRRVVVDRLARLSPVTGRALSIAAVIGDEFDFRVLERVPEMSADSSELTRSLDEAVDARLIVELPAVIGRYRFAHTLIRAATADQLSALHRARLHGEIAEAITATYVSQPDAHLRDLIFHYCQGAPVVDPTPAASLGVRAARLANERLTYSDAADIASEVLRALDLADVDAADLRVELLAEHAFALTQLGDWAAGSDAQRAAVELAGRLGSVRALARILARRQSMATPIVGAADASTLAVVDRALAVGGADDDDATIAALLAWSTMHRAANGEGENLTPLAQEAVERARRAGDIELEAFALHARYLALLGSHDLSTLRATAKQLRELRPDDLLTQMLGHRFVALTNLISGDREGFASSFASMKEMFDSTRSKFWRVLIEMWAPMLALVDGDLEAAESLIDRVLDNASADPNQLLAWLSQSFALRREQHRLSELEATVDAAALERPGLAGLRCLQLGCRVAAGDHDLAAAILDDLGVDRFSNVPRDWLFPWATAQLTMACALLDRADHADALYELLLPYEGTMIVCATATYVEGAADRFLGILAGILGRFEDADSHFASAVAFEEHFGSTLQAAHTRYWHAQMLR